jgi:hypothetical protein
MRPVADGLFTDETPPRLIGGRDIATGKIVLPCPPYHCKNGRQVQGNPKTAYTRIYRAPGVSAVAILER